ncbi:uncharacterized protein LOC115762667 [Drosophila novamexicana]|uniref:uncharacterized protein LOC115762667 n=1 Tax=Drosophila novamexicana TaxID=47314 RepID=UPI0011E59837|nr:uncharacterized protein LOC115762667 [Drosophila novamexicana]
MSLANMNSHNIIKELNVIPATIKIDALSWQQGVLKGGDQMKIYAELCAKIFESENQLNNAKRSRELRHTKKRIHKLFKRLDKAYNQMKHILETLSEIRLRTEHMWRRVRLWNDDELIREHCITWELTTSKLLEFLQFLTQRYDCEWEIKEMVMNELEKVSDNYDANILLEAWLDNSHAGGDEFERKLIAFYSSVGQRQATTQYYTKYA